MPASRWIGFLLVWVALVILTADGLRAARRARAAVPASPEPPESERPEPERPVPVQAVRETT
jgi:chloramphenicol-sensitive protein RarD